MARESSASVKSADRVLLLLEYLADAREATFGSITRDLQIPNSSAHQLLQNILSRGFIEYDPQRRTFRLGFRLWEIAQTYEPAEDLVSLAQPLMDELTVVTTETVQLARLDGIENVYLAISESPHPMKLVSKVGARLMAHATGLGKVLLSGLDDDELRRRLDGVTLPRFTDQTITDPDRLEQELRRIRQRGYGTDEGEYVLGCWCVAMPIRNGTGQTIAAMSVSVPTPRVTHAITQKIRKDLGTTVGNLEGRIGHLR
jgi:DNA-binding IclR family transcriptional regulator